MRGAIVKRRTHGELKREVMKAVNRLPGVFVFPTGVGSFHTGTRFIRLGMRGTSDLVGWKERTVETYHDVGGITVPRFLALEIKTGKDKLSPEQAAFLARVREAGGIAVEVRSVEDAIAALK